MEEEPGVLEELGSILTNIRLNDENLFFQYEKLVEVIQLELRYVVCPDIAEGQNPTFHWTDGSTNIFISIHVEEDQYSYSLEITNIPKKN
jgi:hypothetical protein